jgi:heptosyltransferase-2
LSRAACERAHLSTGLVVKERSIQPERIERVLVRGANWVGDAVMTIPALRELRRVMPRAHITLAVRAWASGIFEGADFIDDLMLLEGNAGGGVASFLRQRRNWRARRFDLALLFPNAFEPALVAAAARIPFRVGYATDWRRVLLTHPLALPPWRSERHEVFYYLNLVAELERLLGGASRVETHEPCTGLRVSDERKEAAREILRRHGVSFGLPGRASFEGAARLRVEKGSALEQRTLVALCPGSTNSRAKRWPEERFAALADQLIEEAGAQCILIGAREELDVSERVAAQMRNKPVVLTGQTSLAETVAVLSLVDLLVTNDTGPAHIAAALGRPTLVIFGPTNPTTTRPFSTLAEVVRQPPECAPCMLRDCPIDHRCMTAITPEDVFRRAAKLLDEGEAIEAEERSGVGAAR